MQRSVPISSDLFRCKPRPGLLSDARRDYGKECANNRDYGNESGANAVRANAARNPRMRLLSYARPVLAATASLAAVTIPGRRRRSILLAVELCRCRRRSIQCGLATAASARLVVLSSLLFFCLALHV